jgi:hypothetical protein
MTKNQVEVVSKRRKQSRADGEGVTWKYKACDSAEEGKCARQSLEMVVRDCDEQSETGGE